MEKRKPIEDHKFTYAFDLRQRARGLVVAKRVAENATELMGDWCCSATDDADAVRQALKAAEHEWPAIPDRKFNDFIVRFATPEESDEPGAS